MSCRALSLVLSLLIPGSRVGAGEPTASAPAPQTSSSAVVSLDGDRGLPATDPRNEGREAKWFAAPREEAKPTKVPWIIQDALPGYHGVAWYWREFNAPKNPHARGRHLLRFWAADYLAEVWVNGTRVGRHEGGESPFVLEVTDAIHAGANDAWFDDASGLMLAEYRLGAGPFILNTLLVRENLGTHPVAERLLRNLLNYAASHAEGGITP